jgi:quercetin dioxygenase-like cupin family protein
MGHKFEPLPRKGDFYKKAWGYELWIVNDEEYCGKLLVFEKDKKFSMHYHLIKKESWYVAKGEFLYSWIETEKAMVKTIQIQEGDVIDLERGQPHQLTALTEGATIFEVSTKHYEEDSYRVFKALQKNAGSDWILENIAVSNKKGFMEVSMWPNWAVKRILRCTTLEDIIERNNINKIDYLKIDIEGGEKDLIPSIQPETWNKINKIFIEYHEDVFGYSEEARTEFIKTIQQYGFTFHVSLAGNQSFMYFWRV